MKRIVFLFVAVFILSGCIKEDRIAANLQIGDTLPDFREEMSDARTVTDEMLKETVSVVMFFHTSCPDCRQVLPRMQQIYDEYALKNVQIALISREEIAESIESFWNEKGLKMPYSAQKSRVVYETFAQERIPRVYICEKGGIIRYIFTDDPNPSYDDLKSALENVIR